MCLLVLCPPPPRGGGVGKPIILKYYGQRAKTFADYKVSQALKTTEAKSLDHDIVCTQLYANEAKSNHGHMHQQRFAYNTFEIMASAWGAGKGAVARALASYQCALGSIPALCYL